MPELLSRTEIARRLKRSPEAVIKAISRLHIAHAELRGSRPHYPLSTVELVRKGMRKANRNREER